MPPSDPATVAEPLVWTIAETAKVLGLCQKSIWALTHAGKLPACRFGRSVRYDRRDVLAFVEASKGGMAAPDTPPALAPPPPAGVLAEGGHP